VTAPNRFYQVPHCTGMGYEQPQTLIAMRAIKAEGGWGVVNTEYCSVDPSSDDRPYPYASLWDESDRKTLARLAEGVHAHGALAGVELWHGGLRSANQQTRATALGPVSLPASRAPWQARAMDLADIRAYRQAHREAALRAKAAGFDLIYVYAAHSYLLDQFLNAPTNPRDDGYGGDAAGRRRLLLEVLEETRAAVGDRCAIAIRIEVDDEAAPGVALPPERRALFQAVAPYVDLFDVTIVDYYQEMGSSRFHQEASLEPFVRAVKALTGRPVVGVGRFTSPDTMADQLRRGVLDLIGAARPSIADPFLPAKIRDGDYAAIRECIGCNICYAHNSLGVPIRCTQNPTIGEEWRRGWHPERVPAATEPRDVLVVGAGPAGLEAALTLGRAGHRVLLAEAGRELGGSVQRQRRLPGLAEWGRVADWRVGQLAALPNVEIFRESRMGAEDVLAAGPRHVVLATGSAWRRDGRGRSSALPLPGLADSPLVLTPEQIMAGERPAPGPVVIYDDDHYYLAAVLAELLAREGRSVAYVATSDGVAAWSMHTAEQSLTWKRLADLGVEIVLHHAIARLAGETLELACLRSGAAPTRTVAGVVTVTSREPDAALWRDLGARDHGLELLLRAGDCEAPGLIAQAVYGGHRVARELCGPAEAAKRERPVVT
jgi:dimethylamine/trimethylamine dehydrogenase